MSNIPNSQIQAYKQIPNQYADVLIPGFQVSVCLSAGGTLNASFRESALWNVSVLLQGYWGL